VHQSGTSDEARFDLLKKQVAEGGIPFAYVSLGKMDALMHKVGNQGAAVTALVRWYDVNVREIISVAEAAYGNVSWYVFTDHGMHNTTGAYDLAGDVERLGLRYGKDYVAFYDATMARFWFLNDEARRLITAMLSTHDKGRIVPDGELQQLGVYFEDHLYGDLVFLMNSAIQIVPSFMGNKRVAGLHGFHPGDADSYAMMLSNRPIPDDVQRIHQIHGLMLREMPELIPT
jgi:predicted AlkP superfamily pyrophosphatase or phosphodiesterase